MNKRNIILWFVVIFSLTSCLEKKDTTVENIDSVNIGSSEIVSNTNVEETQIPPKEVIAENHQILTPSSNFFDKYDISFSAQNSYTYDNYNIAKDTNLSTGFITLFDNEKELIEPNIEDYEIIWKEPFIEKKIRQLLDKTNESIMLSDLLVIEDFHLGTDFPRFAVKTLADFSHFKNLKKLWLVGANISDLTPLTNLRLVELYIDNNESAGDYSLGDCKDLNPLKNMTSLEKLTLTGSKLTDLSPLSSLTKLKELDIRTTNVVNLSPLSNLIHLEKLYISNFNMDLSPLKGLNRIEVLPKLDSYNNKNEYFEERNLLLNIKLDIPKFNLNWFRTSREIKVRTESTNDLKITQKEDDYEVVFDNSVIEQIVRILTNNYGGPLKKSDLDKVTDLDLSYKNLTSLDDLMHFQNLEVLNLSNNKLTSLEQISQLQQLKDLDVSNNNLESIEPLSKFKNLQNLDISDNDISDISSLDKLTSLLSLAIHNNSISDISKLSELKHLLALNISNNLISDISVVENFSLLLSLRASKNSISEIGSISNLSQLFELDVSENSITDIDELSNLKNLEILNIFDNSINCIDVVANFNILMGFNAGGNNIENIDAITNLSLLKSLILYENNITDVGALKELINLESLFLSQNKISDISLLKDLIHLKSLSISKNAIEDISITKAFTNLTNFYFDNNKITDVSALTEHPNLVTVNYWENPIENMDPLYTIPNVDWR